MPRILHHLHFVSHGQNFTDHGDALRDRFLECDILVPELCNWSPARVMVAKRLARGEVPFDTLDTVYVPGSFDKVPNSYDVFLWRLIENSGKHILVVDQRCTKASLRLRSEWQGWYATAHRTFREGNYLAAVNRMERAVAAIAQSIREREDGMVRQFAKIARYVARTPLQEQDEVRVLMTIGKGHDVVYDRLRDAGYEVTSSIGGGASAPQYFQLCIREHMAGHGPSEELLARVLAASVIYRALSERGFLNDDLICDTGTALCRQLSLKQIQAICWLAPKYESAIELIGGFVPLPLLSNLLFS